MNECLKWVIVNQCLWRWTIIMLNVTLLIVKNNSGQDARSRYHNYGNSLRFDSRSQLRKQLEKQRNQEYNQLLKQQQVEGQNKMSSFFFFQDFWNLKFLVLICSFVLYNIVIIYLDCRIVSCSFGSHSNVLPQGMVVIAHETNKCSCWNASFWRFHQ